MECKHSIVIKQQHVIYYIWHEDKQQFLYSLRRIAIPFLNNKNPVQVSDILWFAKLILLSQENMRHFSSTLQMRNLNSERESDLSKVLWLLSESNRAWPQVSWALTHCSFYPFGLFPGPLHGSFWNDVLLTCLLPLSCCKTSSLNPVVCLEPIFQRN